MDDGDIVFGAIAALALVVSIVAAWYTSGQASAAKQSVEEARDANKLVREQIELERKRYEEDRAASRVRWRVERSGKPRGYLVRNVGWDSAWDVRITCTVPFTNHPKNTISGPGGFGNLGEVGAGESREFILGEPETGFMGGPSDYDLTVMWEFRSGQAPAIAPEETIPNQRSVVGIPPPLET